MWCMQATDIQSFNYKLLVRNTPFNNYFSPCFRPKMIVGILFPLRIVLMDDALDCLMSFTDFLLAFQLQFYYQGTVLIHPSCSISTSINELINLSMYKSERVLVCVLLKYTSTCMWCHGLQSSCRACCWSTRTCWREKVPTRSSSPRPPPPSSSPLWSPRRMTKRSSKTAWCRRRSLSVSKPCVTAPSTGSVASNSLSWSCISH